MDLPSLERIAVLEAENEYMEMDMNDEEETEGQTHSVTQPSLGAVTSDQRVHEKRKRKAKCWKEFTDIGIEDDGKERVRCDHCGTKIIIEKTYGTSTLNRHLLICPDRPKSEEHKYDHKVDREMIAEIIIFHDLPFRYVEYEKVRARDRFLNPDVKHICRQTAGLDVYRRYELEKSKLIEDLAKHKSRVFYIRFVVSS